MGKCTGSKLVKEYIKAVYCHPAYLTSVQSCCSVAQLCPALCNPIDCSMPDFLSITNPWRLLKLISIELVISSNHLILCCPLLLLPSIFPSISLFK